MNKPNLPITPFEEGQIAHLAGESLGGNPYTAPADFNLSLAWNYGWHRWQECLDLEPGGG